MINLEVDALKIALICIYAPNQDSPGFFEELILKSEEFYPEKVIIGDFNLVLNTNLDRLNSMHNNYRAANSLKVIMEEHYLIDIW